MNFPALDLPAEQNLLIDWLCSEEWPFHGNSRLTPEKVLNFIEEGVYAAPEKQAFWMVDQAGVRVGLIRIFDLDDVDTGAPLFDIRIRSRYRGQGLGFEAVTWLTNYLFTTWPQLQRIEGNTRADNVAMRRVFMKCLYAKEGHHRKTWPSSSGEKIDAVSYAILREDWEKKTITPVPWAEDAVAVGSV